MSDTARDTGIEALGSTSWGTHFCVFYETGQDLADILVPYYKAGLENNEFCVLAASEPLDEVAFTKIMQDNIPDFAHYLETGYIQIIPHTDIYLRNGIFSQKRVLNAITDMYTHNLSVGYDGMRAAANIAWLEENDWESFAAYEEQINRNFGEHRIIILCAYRLSQSSTTQLLQVMHNHQFALIRQEGQWLVLKPQISQETTPAIPSAEQLSLLQEWFLRSGFEGLGDQEVTELLLGIFMSYGAAKKLANRCFKHFQSLREFMAASPEELQQAGVPPLGVLLVKLLHELPAEILKQRVIGQPAYKSPEEIMDYLYYSMRDIKKEVFKVLYLDSQNRITDVHDLFHGQVDSAHVHLHTIFKTAIEHGAVALVFVHNHPSGDPAPSKSDRQLTRDLVFAGNVTQINVLDHIVIGGDSYFSFATAGLIEKYKNDFLNLRMRQIIRSK